MRSADPASFPDHGIIGEEYGNERTEAEYVWALDPIDGTKSFICGMPVWGTLIALPRGGAPLYGMMHQPFTREQFTGDGGRHYRGPTGKRSVRVRQCATLADAILSTTSPLLMQKADRRTSPGSRSGAAVALWRRLLRLLHARRRPYRSADRNRIEALRCFAADSDHHGRRRSDNDVGEGTPPHSGGRIVAAGDERVHAAALDVLKSSL